MEETCKSLDVTKSEYEKLEQELEELEQEIQKAREVTTRKTLEKQNLENRIHLLQEQIRSAVQRKSSIRRGPKPCRLIMQKNRGRAGIPGGKGKIGENSAGMRAYTGSSPVGI